GGEAARCEGAGAARGGGNEGGGATGLGAGCGRGGMTGVDTWGRCAGFADRSLERTVAGRLRGAGAAGPELGCGGAARLLPVPTSTSRYALLSDGPTRSSIRLPRQ